MTLITAPLFLRDAGYSVLLIDFQAPGESPGDVITFGWRERLDILAAVDFLHRELPGQRIAILGSSLGGAAALLATPPLRVDALVIESVYPSIDRAAANRLRACAEAVMDRRWRRSRRPMPLRRRRLSPALASIP